MFMRYHNLIKTFGTGLVKSTLGGIANSTAVQLFTYYYTKSDYAAKKINDNKEIGVELSPLSPENPSINHASMLVKQAFIDSGFRYPINVHFDINIPSTFIISDPPKDLIALQKNSFYIIHQPVPLENSDPNQLGYEVIYLDKKKHEEKFYLKISMNGIPYNGPITSELLKDIRYGATIYTNQPLSNNMSCIWTPSVYNKTAIVSMGMGALFNTHEEIYAMAGHEAIHALHNHIAIKSFVSGFSLVASHNIIMSTLLKHSNNLRFSFNPLKIASIAGSVGITRYIVSPIISRLLEKDADITSAKKLGTANHQISNLQKQKDIEFNIPWSSHPTHKTRINYLSKLDVSRTSLLFKSKAYQQIKDEINLNSNSTTEKNFSFSLSKK